MKWELCYWEYAVFPHTRLLFTRCIIENHSRNSWAAVVLVTKRRMKKVPFSLEEGIKVLLEFNAVDNVTWNDANIAEQRWVGWPKAMLFSFGPRRQNRGKQYIHLKRKMLPSSFYLLDGSVYTMLCKVYLCACLPPNNKTTASFQSITAFSHHPRILILLHSVFTTLVHTWMAQ